MTIQIHEPELEALIQRRLKGGGFRNAEEVILHAMKSSPEPVLKRGELQGKNLVEVCASVRGLLTDEEIDTLFRRDPSPDRPIHLS